MSEKYENLQVASETFEPFVLCLALGTLEAMKAQIWSSEAGIWTIGRPVFLNKLEQMNVSEETLNALFQFDELNALEGFAKKETYHEELLKIEQTIKKRLADFPNGFWHAQWTEKEL